MFIIMPGKKNWGAGLILDWTKISSPHNLRGFAPSWKKLKLRPRCLSLKSSWNNIHLERSPGCNDWASFFSPSQVTPKGTSGQPWASCIAATSVRLQYLVLRHSTSASRTCASSNLCSNSGSKMQTTGQDGKFCILTISVVKRVINSIISRLVISLVYQYYSCYC